MFMFSVNVCLCVDTYSTFLCASILYIHICVYFCVSMFQVVHAALLLAYDCRFDRNIL